MDRALDQSFSSKPFLKGILVSDLNGLCIAAKGDVSEDKAGRFTAIAKAANELSQVTSSDQQAATVLIETEDRDILIKEYDSLTIVLSSAKLEE